MKTKLRKDSMNESSKKQMQDAKTAAVPTNQADNTPVFKQLVPLAIAIVVILGVVGILFKNQLVVAWVNGKPITRSTYISDMEKQVGAQTLENLVMKLLIQQEAQKQGVSVSPEEISNEMQAIEGQFSGQGQNLDALLLQEGVTREELSDQIHMQKLVEKLAPQDASPSAEEIAEFVESNQQFLPENTSQAELESIAREQLSNQLQQEQTSEWLESLKAQADIIYW